MQLKSSLITGRRQRMNGLWSHCIEQNDNEELVMHEVHGSLDGVKYKLNLKAPCPMTAIQIAQRVPTIYWEIENV
jgi:hypothetical protein